VPKHTATIENELLAAAQADTKTTSYLQQEHVKVGHRICDLEEDFNSVNHDTFLPNWNTLE
jgi:hypothetical protein